MDPLRLARVAALANLPVVMAGLITIVRGESDLFTGAQLIVGLLGPLPALIAAWPGARLARTATARWVLACGVAAAALLMAAAYVIAATAGPREPLAPLLIVLASLWQAGGLALLLPVVALIGRRPSA